jgi:5'-deoxynucleotidase YfbR-like HD superfamily hydrolase
MTAPAVVLPGARLAAVGGLLREVGDLKRVRVAHAAGSAAQRAFFRAWSALVAGDDAERVAARECAAAVAGARLAGIDAATLLRCGLTAAQARAVLAGAVDEVAGGLAAGTVGWLRGALRDLVAAAAAGEPGEPDRLPGFVGALARQPRAGATAPGRPRLIVEPPEDHAEHCWAVAVHGALLAADFGAEPADAFLLGLAHHLHNATLPDAGFAGETLLGEHLEAVVDRLTERELATLPPALADRLRGLLACRADADTATGRAFHAADVLDRVLQVHHHARAAGFTAGQALVDLELVHAGPVTGFHHAVLAAAGL